MVFNVLDNALESSPHWVAMDARCDGDTLVIEISDAGTGFVADVLQRLGVPPTTPARGGRAAAWACSCR